MKRYIITCIVALMGLLCAQAESISVGDVVMDKGEIIERGTHEELLEQKGRYYQLYTGSTE